ncbi:MAG: hypothetical protein IPP90_19925 [Gemmatimonadaceae bacterium]|nr:hypothetical protein [Gemmatimonadaceae bacterium]
MVLPAIFSLPTIDSSVEQLESTVRLRLVDCRVEHARGALTRAVVECDGPATGQRTVGRQEGSSCPGGDLRLAALATLDAVTQATCGALTLDLIGVKPLRAFDTNIVVVAVLAHHEGKATRIVGAALAEDDALIGTARATMHAINRLASPLLTRLVI